MITNDIQDKPATRSAEGIAPSEQNNRQLSVPDHQGSRYTKILTHLHEWLKPATYFEIGTAKGESLAIANCASVAVDPDFRLGTRDVLGTKPFCALYRMPSDTFFRRHELTRIFDGPVDLAFLDGWHHSEYLLRDFANTERHCRRNSVVALHDCVPVETTIAGRIPTPSPEPSRAGWWAGDVWRTLVALIKHRPDLSVTVLDARPTGLALITNLDPQSRVLTDDYCRITREMMSVSLEDIGFREFFSMIHLEPTSVIEAKDKMSQRFWL